MQKGVSRHIYVRLSPRSTAVRTAFANVLSGRLQEPDRTPIGGNDTVDQRATPVRFPAGLGEFRDPACCTGDVLAG
jgi:hypothetical protein